MTEGAKISSPEVKRTPRIFSSSINNLSTLVSRRITTCKRSISVSSALTTSFALFVTGNIRPWSSSFNATPSPSKKFIMSSLLKTEKGPYKNRPLPGICLIISSCDKRFVTLHRPPPDMASLLPGFFPFSSTRTLCPCSAAARDAINPDGPAPIIITSYIYETTLPFFFHYTQVAVNRCEKGCTRVNY